MKQRKPMNRISAKRRAQMAERPERVRAVAVPIPPEVSARIRYSSAANAAQAVPKEGAIEHKGYRRLVAGMSCIRCIKAPPSQCAHANYGKGMGFKTDDRMTFPMCPPCHTALDQGAAYTKEVRRVMEQQWAADTRRLIKRLGMWPADLAEWPADMEQTA